MLIQGNELSALIAAAAARNTAYIALGGSVLTAIMSVVLAALNNRASRRNQKELQELKSNSEAKLAHLNADISTEQAEQNARRDYLYEARKRLYKECEPLLFRLAEAAENSLHRIFSLARSSRNGNLVGEARWLAQPGYYMSSTLYHLLAPCAIFRLLQEQLTLVDLEVDSRIKQQYLLAKWVYISFTDDFSLAHTDPVLSYDPHVKDWHTARTQSPAVHWRQGVPLGRLDVAAEGLMIVGLNGNTRIRTYGEFEEVFYEDLASDRKKFGTLVDVFTDFNPGERPVLWRILIVQALLCRELLRVFRNHEAPKVTLEQLAFVAEKDLKNLSWRATSDSGDEAFTAASNYFRDHLPVIFDQLREMMLVEGGERAAGTRT